MSHTTTVNNVSFIHNGDYSGDVEIVLPPKKNPGVGNVEEMSLTVHFDAIKDFMAEYVRSELIEKIENASSDEILKKLFY